MMKIRTCAIQCHAKHNGKARNKTSCGREQRHMNRYTLGCLQEQAKWPIGVPIRLSLEFCIFAKRLFYEKKKTRFKSSDCTAEAIRTSFWLISYCLEKSNWTHTHNYCNPVAHARRGLNIHISCEHNYWTG